ncbi:unnamed protein product [Pneumocystis jirovecii]|uniref:Protein-S-isoprenylcysteine O-methyltransferase n=1 Tax=Pneumocystis jirovecii TaxID=42068 RepID=L0PGB6_PNEJI|nr:unnamed protein product [Pneumocystis jirovecii]
MTNISEKHNVNSNKNHKSHDFIKAEIAIRAVILGFVMGSSFLSSFHVNFSQLTIYFVFLSLFHFLEFWITALYNPLNASISCRIPIFSSNKNKHSNFQGFVIACFGQICRTLSMIHATQNFSHKISLKKVKEHVLVTNGIYRWIRHPSYFGFFFWAIGSQIMLLNPLSSIAYTVILWGKKLFLYTFLEMTI